MTYEFTKPRHLASIIWDKDENKVKVRFNKEGLFKTDDPELASFLASKGYPPTEETLKNMKKKEQARRAREKQDGDE